MNSKKLRKLINIIPFPDLELSEKERQDIDDYMEVLKKCGHAHPEEETWLNGEDRLKCSKLCNAKIKCTTCIFLKKICNNCGWESRRLKGIKICEKCGTELEVNYITVSSVDGYYEKYH